MPKKRNTTIAVKSRQSKKPMFYQAIGRRKTATARVRIYPVVGEKITVNGFSLRPGEIIVNGKPIKEYFTGDIFEKLYSEPFKITNTVNRFAATIKVRGSGLKGQLGAVIHGISRALCNVDKKMYRPLLKSHGLLTRDPRMKERRKAGLAGKARAGKQSPKR